TGWTRGAWPPLASRSRCSRCARTRSSPRRNPRGGDKRRRADPWMRRAHRVVDDALVSGDRSLPVYRLVVALATPIVRWWGRLEVVGLDCVPLSGPTVLMGNHDSHWDPVVAAVAAPPRRPIRAPAQASPWPASPLPPVLRPPRA